MFVTPLTFSLVFSGIYDEMGLDPVQEYAVPLDEYVDLDFLTLDIAFPEYRIAVEADGPAHYVHDLDAWDPTATYIESKRQFLRGYEFLWNETTHVISGSTALKERLLKQLGWTVIHLPFWAWDEAVREDPAKQRQLCQDLLQGTELQDRIASLT